MFTVENCIRELLFEQECVIIPDFGGFITKYKSAIINHFGQVIYPPTKSVSFNRQLRNDDGLLVNTYAQFNHVTFSDASLGVKSWIANFVAKLNTEHQITIEKVGKFLKSEDGGITFEFFVGENYLDESYGLPVVQAVAIQRGIESESILKQIEATELTVHSEIESAETEMANDLANKRSSNLSIVAVAILSVLLIASAVLPFARVNAPQLNLNEAGVYRLFLSVVSFKNDVDIAPIAVASPVSNYIKGEDQLSIAKPVFVSFDNTKVDEKVQETTVITENNVGNIVKYLVVAGVFREQSNAERLFNDLLGKKINAAVREIKRGSVSYVGFDWGFSEAEAVAVMNKAKQQSIECWVKRM